MAYINFLLSFVVIRDVLSFVLGKTTSLPVDQAYNAEGTGIMLVLPLFCMLLGTLVIRVGPKVKVAEVRSPKISAEMEKLKLLQVSDLHISAGLPEKFVEKLVTKINELKPDLVFFTGDILDKIGRAHV